MQIQFPSSYPFEEVFKLDAKVIALTGLPYFDSRWLKEKEFFTGFSLKDRCIKVMINSTSIGTDELNILPLELL